MRCVHQSNWGCVQLRAPPMPWLLTTAGALVHVIATHPSAVPLPPQDESIDAEVLNSMAVNTHIKS